MLWLAIKSDYNVVQDINFDQNPFKFQIYTLNVKQTQFFTKTLSSKTQTISFISQK